MRGYRVGHTASPRVVGDTLVVALGSLLGLSVHDGSTQWVGGAYRDYGTPAVGVVGGVPLVVTPEGRLLDARSGRVLSSGLGDQWYEGPHLHEDTVYFVGATGYGAGDGAVSARAWRLQPEADTVKAVPLWQKI